MKKIAHSDKKKQKEFLGFFTRYPNPGKTKTRLIPVLGPEGAANLHRQMTVHAVIRLRQLLIARDITLDIYHEGGTSEQMARWLGPDLRYLPQTGIDLGDRMINYCRHAFDIDADSVVMVGSDVPGISSDLLGEAFDSLQKFDVVIGPAKDGGYYLIGLKKPLNETFKDIEWGGPDVFEQTQIKIAEAGSTLKILPALADVDCPEDMNVWEQERISAESSYPLSVIIPTLNEAGNIAMVISDVRREDAVEIIVTDGGSNDGTADIAKEYGARVVHSEPGRARQMNNGIKTASGNNLLFLHADTRLPKGFTQQINTALSVSGVAAGAFELQYDKKSPGLSRIERLANWRSRTFQMPYGDQGIFSTANNMQLVGGFPELPIMEDFELMKRLKRIGRIEIVPEFVTTSSRRQEKIGLLKSTLINQVVIAAYLTGISPDRIARWYGEVIQFNNNTVY